MSIYQGVNLFEITRSGQLTATADTTYFSGEPTGVAFNPANGHLFFSDDTGSRWVWELDPGEDGDYKTPDDNIITSFSTNSFGSSDPEGITFDSWQGNLFIADGVGTEVYQVKPGSDSAFGTGDDRVSHFDISRYNIPDPEGIAFNSSSGTLFVLGRNSMIAEVTTEGTLLRKIDVTAANAVKPAGLAYAPGSADPNKMALYITDRGVDNNTDSKENDGRVYEMSFSYQSGSPTPTPDPSPTSHPTSTPTPRPTSIPTDSPNPPDVNSDGKVDKADMQLVLGVYGGSGTCGSYGQYDCDLVNDGKVNSLDASMVYANWTATPPPTPLPPGSLEMYGVRYADTTDYHELASLGAMNPSTVVGSNSEIDDVITAARNVRNSYPNFKPSLVLYSGGYPFTCSGVSAQGESFIRHLNNNNYWNEIFSINGLHEPLGSKACSSISQIQGVVSEIKRLSNNQAKILDKIYSDTSYKGMGFADGICDYCAVLYHPYRGNTTGEFRKATLLSNLERDISLIKSTPPGQTLNKFTPWLCTIHYPGAYSTGLYVPPPSEMLDGGTSIINFTSSNGYQTDGFEWYTWSSRSKWVGLGDYDEDGQRAGRMDVVQQMSETGP